MEILTAGNRSNVRAKKLPDHFVFKFADKKNNPRPDLCFAHVEQAMRHGKAAVVIARFVRAGPAFDPIGDSGVKSLFPSIEQIGVKPQLLES